MKTKPQFKLSWNQGSVSVIYPKAATPEEALQLAIEGCPTSLLPGTEVRVERLDGLKKIFVKTLTVPLQTYEAERVDITFNGIRYDEKAALA